MKEQYANALLAVGTFRRAAKEVNCSEVYLRQQMEGEWIYFFAIEDKVKIGYTKDFAQRAKSFRLHAGGAGRFLLLIRGGKDKEKKIHSDLSSERLHNEWFLLNKNVRAYIKEVCNVN